jgi:glutamate carboxypeptidase
MTPDLQTYFNSQLDPMMVLLQDLIAIESPTSEKAAVDRMGARVAEELARLGGEVTTHPRTAVGDIVEARWNASMPGQPLLFVCHMDTVHPIGAIAQNPIRVNDGRLHGPGSYDMKASITTVIGSIEGLRTMDIFPERPIIALMTTDEETGSFDSRGLIQDIARDSALAMIMEPALPDGALKTWRKSTANFVVRTYGIASHAGGAHESGLNAIEEMAHQVLRLQRMTDYKVGSTVSVGMISGGTARNTVPDFCEAMVDARAMTVDEMARMTKLLMSLEPVQPGARVEVEGGFDRPPMERNSLMMETFNQAKEIGAKYGLTLREAGSGGGSDGNYTAALGTPTLDGLGPIGDGAHSEREHIIVNSLASSATLLAGILLEWPQVESGAS